MNSKKFLRRLHNNLGCEDCKNNKCKNNREILRECDRWYETIYEDLDQLEKLEKVIKILKEAVDGIEIITCDEEDCYGELCLYQKINGSISIPLKTKEEYILAKEVLSNER